MELDSFLASPRWEILEIISEKPSSPIEIAEKLNTTVSYVSQQLKLLEAAGLVIKRRTGAVERGKPRTLFSVAKEAVYLVCLTKGFSKKRFLYLTEYHKIILRIWFLENTALHHPLEKFFWQIEKYLDKIKAIFIEKPAFNPRIIIISEEKNLKQKIESTLSKIKEEITLDFISESNLNKLDPDVLYTIYDAHLVFKRLKELKGGTENND